MTVDGTLLRRVCFFPHFLMRKNRILIAAGSVCALAAILTLSMAHAEDATQCRITDAGFQTATWQCYDGTTGKGGGDTSCKPSTTWQEYARKACDGHCNSETGKCGVNSFGVDGTCGGQKICTGGSVTQTPLPTNCPMSPSDVSSKAAACMALQDGHHPIVRDDNGCYTFVDCVLGGNDEKPKPFVNQSTTTTATTSTVSCSKTTMGNGCSMYKCDDGAMWNTCSMKDLKETMQKMLPPRPMPPLSPTVTGPCSDIEKSVKDLYAQLQKDPGNTDLKKQLTDLVSKWNDCRKSMNGQMKPPAVTATTSVGMTSSCKDLERQFKNNSDNADLKAKLAACRQMNFGSSIATPMNGTCTTTKNSVTGCMERRCGDNKTVVSRICVTSIETSSTASTTEQQ